MLSPLWGLGIKFMLPGLAASNLTHKAISPIPLDSAGVPGFVIPIIPCCSSLSARDWRDTGDCHFLQMRLKVIKRSVQSSLHGYRTLCSPRPADCGLVCLPHVVLLIIPLRGDRDAVRVHSPPVLRGPLNHRLLQFSELSAPHLAGFAC